MDAEQHLPVVQRGEAEDEAATLSAATRLMTRPLRANAPEKARGQAYAA